MLEMTITAEGFQRIELLESEKGTFFDSGKSTLNGGGKEMVVLLANEQPSESFRITSRSRDTPMQNRMG